MQKKLFSLIISFLFIFSIGNAGLRLVRNPIDIDGLKSDIDKALEEFRQVDWERIIAEEKLIYSFGEGQAEGSADMKPLLGGKGAHLAEMSNLGLPVPFGFTLTTQTTDYYFRIQSLKQIFEQIDVEHLPTKLEEQLGEERITALIEAKGLIEQYEAKLKQEVMSYLKDQIEDRMGRKFGDLDSPLLVSVRSGAAVSMPGMMDTVPNVGLNDETVHGLAAMTEDGERFAYDSYQLFIRMFGSVVLGANEERFKQIERELMEEEGYKDESEFTTEDFKYLVERFKEELDAQGLEIPRSPIEQLFLAINAVYESTLSPRAQDYRRINNIALEDSLSAVNVQAMVFGNMDDESGTGVLFTHNRNTGEEELTGNYLHRAQGEALVSGVREAKTVEEFAQDFPEIYEELAGYAAELFQHYKDMQDIEFTIESGKLWVLQTRRSKQHPRAIISLNVDLVNRGWITKQEAVMRFDNPELVTVLLNPQFDQAAKEQAKKEGRILAVGIAASPGAGVGQVVFNSEDAISWSAEGKETILVRRETAAEDVAGMDASVGILTSRGDTSCHAAVVASQRGKPAVVGTRALIIDYENEQFNVNGNIIKEGDYISIDGATGEVFIGEIKTVASVIIRAQEVEAETGKNIEDVTSEEMAKLSSDIQLTPEEIEFYLKYKLYMSWADEIRGGLGKAPSHSERVLYANRKFSQFEVLAGEDSFNQICRVVRGKEETDWPAVFTPREGKIKVKANAELPKDVRRAVAHKAEGIGLARTEHMFEENLPLTQKLLQGDMGAAKELQKYQQEIFEENFRILNGRPYRVRWFDAPLHEFLPEEAAEENPMFGNRAVRMLIAHPEIAKLQTRAFFQAALNVKDEGIDVKPEVMVPLVNEVSEFKFIKDIIVRIGTEEFGLRYDEEQKDFLVGTMIEVIGGVLNAGEIAKEADFLSFGTNDLTQAALAFSRDDTAEITNVYKDEGILEAKPFKSIVEPVALFVALTVIQAREANPDILIGICGEQGYDPISIEKYLVPLGLDSVSGAAAKVPVARLAVGQSWTRRINGEMSPYEIVFEDSNVGELDSTNFIYTEDSFLEADVIEASRELILNNNPEKLLPLQISYYRQIFEQMEGDTANIRLLDVPLGDFFEGQREQEEFKERNPALGNRGVRLAITSHPQLYKAQVEAIFKAAAGEIKTGKEVDLRILVPFIIQAEEFKIVKGMIDNIARDISQSEGVKFNYQVGASIDTPSGVLDAGKLSELADFLVIDWHRLTENTLGIFEADARNSFLPIYLEKGIYSNDPFEVIQPHIQRLINVAVNRARSANEDIEIFIINR